jgi:outer membrane protein, heavy metal efflux system
MPSFVLRAAAWAALSLPALALAAPLTLEQALGQAVQRSQALQSARAATASAGHLAEAAGQLPDPMLGVSIENLPVTGADRFRTTAEGMTMKRIALSQEWVPGDKRALRTAAALAAGGRQQAGAAIAAADARLQTALAYVEAFYANEALKLAVSGEEHAHEAAGTAQARLAAGGGSAQDVLALSAAQGLAEDDTAEMRQQAASWRVNLARWIGQAADELRAPVIASLPDEDAYVASHPMVVAAQRDLDVARQEAALAAANRKPNWTWEVAYGQRTGMSDLVSFGVTIPLQVAPAARQDKETASKLALVTKAEADLAEAQRTAQAEARVLASDARRLADRIERIRAAVVEPARQRTAAALAGYRSNQASLAMVFEARHAETEAQRKLLMLQRDLAKAQAQMVFKPVKAEELQ